MSDEFPVRQQREDRNETKRWELAKAHGADESTELVEADPAPEGDQQRD